MDPDSTATVGRVPHGGEEAVELDFSANTNPEMPSGVRDIYNSALEAARSYPPEPPTAFCEAASDYIGCDADSIVPTPGGLAAIRLAIEVTVEPDDSVLVPAPSFGEYAREVTLQGATPTIVDQQNIVERDPTPHAMAIICHPNNPTGHAYSAGQLKAFARRCRAAETTLLVDEAFLDFTDRPSLAGVDGVIVARSLTKMFGLPGIRAGFAAGDNQTIAKMAATRRPWNLGAPALSVGTYCLKQSSFIERTRTRVREERERLTEALSETFDVSPSEAPFLLLDVGEGNVDSVLTATRERGIAVRDARTFRGLNSHIRIAVRLPAENDRLLTVLRDV
ncbi:aminotransferase class I/II-fold pyridoxal phosphate-dependent enzyme [Halovenus rubra]|uniref:Aminotransferase n=2 Tax=Halovenus rubra TaxID=869890 RepID=A0ABD5X174_9EURY|nr:aminotransferase class I/II-fold pyridoxal phosphate-dependent enzyme [Halovenus rubra]